MALYIVFTIVVIVNVLLSPLEFIVGGFYSITGYNVIHSNSDLQKITNKIIMFRLDPEECLLIKDVRFDLGIFFNPDSYWDFGDDESSQNYCLYQVGRALNIPAACAKIRNERFYASQCIYDSDDTLKFEKLSTTERRYFCSSTNEDNTQLVECHYIPGPGDPERPDLQPEQYPITECDKFSLEQSREYCYLSATKSLDECESLNLIYYKEKCYLQFDEECKKSSKEQLREVCKAYRIVDKKFSDN